MPSKLCKIVFYKIDDVSGSNIGSAFDKIQQTIAKSIKNKSGEHIKHINGKYLCIADVTQNKNLYHGVIRKIRMDKDAGATDKDTGIHRDVQLSPTEGLDEDVGFFVNKNYRCLGIQTSRIAPNAQDLCMYIEQFLDIDTPLIPILMLNSNGYSRYANMTSFTSVDIKICPHENPKYFQKSREGDSVYLLANELGAPNITISATCGNYRDREINKSFIDKIVNAFKRNDKFAKKLKVGGMSNVGQKDYIDFIQDKLVYKENIELFGANREITPTQKSEFAKSAWYDKKKEAKRILQEE